MVEGEEAKEEEVREERDDSQNLGITTFLAERVRGESVREIRERRNLLQKDSHLARVREEKGVDVKWGDVP